MPARPKHYWNHTNEYPSGSSFGELLEWHLLNWGTRPLCSKLYPSKSWELWRFVAVVYGKPTKGKNSEDFDSEKKNLNNWRMGIHHPQNNLENWDIKKRILNALFENDQNLLEWRNDLEGALIRPIEPSPFLKLKARNSLSTDTHKNTKDAAEIEVPPSIKTISEHLTTVPDLSEQIAAKHLSHSTAIHQGLADFQLLREQAERLRTEERASAQRSALLLAIEATRANDEERYDAGLRFALGGWLATIRVGADCPDGIKRELERGTRGARHLLTFTGPRVHAFYQNSHDQGFIITENERIIAKSIVDTFEIELASFDHWFAILPESFVLASYFKGELSLRSLPAALGEPCSIDLFDWSAEDGALYYPIDRWDAEVAVSLGQKFIRYFHLSQFKCWEINATSISGIKAVRPPLLANDMYFSDKFNYVTHNSGFSLRRLDSTFVISLDNGVEKVIADIGSNYSREHALIAKNFIVAVGYDGIDVFDCSGEVNLVHRMNKYKNINPDRIRLSPSESIATIEFRKNEKDSGHVCAFKICNGDEIFSEVGIEIAVSPDDTLVAITRHGNNDDNLPSYVALYAVDGTPLGVHNVALGQHRLRFSADGKKLFVFCYDQFVRSDQKIDILDQCFVYDVEFGNFSDLNHLVDFICNVKLKGREEFTDEDLRHANYRDVPFNIVAECQKRLRPTSLG